ncbi:MAG: phosphopentomutase [Anaerovoracaceae bacterium]|jgi:phosphopentomutase
MKRAIIVVLDSLGIGAMPDANDYGDSGSNTLGSIKRSMPDLRIPHLEKLGLGYIQGIDYLNRPDDLKGAYGRMAEKSKGKDTITGHWEIAGLHTKEPFRTFSVFPEEFIREYEERIGVEVIGNYAASGTEIIKELGDEHKRTGKPIVYTSADSVFQVAANVEVIPLERLYEICRIAREMLIGDLSVGRVIARPFVEKEGVYIRTSDRKDYAVSPSGRTMLDIIKDAGKTVYSVGKIKDIFNGQGITESVHADGNMDGVDKTLLAMKEEFSGLIFSNLVDFDSKYGHRRDPVGYGKALEDFDLRLPEFFDGMKEDDVLILCADHGNDPCHRGWDHTREYVPVIFYGKKVSAGTNLGTLSSFATIGATVCHYLGLESTAIGESVLDRIIKL